MSYRAQELAKWRTESQQPYQADVELSEFREWIGFRLYLRPEPIKLSPETLGEFLDDCLVEFIASELMSLKAADITIEDFRRTIGKINEGMREDLDLKTYALKVWPSEDLPIASYSYLDLAERHALHGGEPAPHVDEGIRFARVFLNPAMSFFEWERDMSQLRYVSRWVDHWWRNPSHGELLTLIRKSDENATTYDILLSICWVAVDQDKRELLPPEVLQWFLGASLGRPKRPDPRPAASGRPLKIGYRHRDNEIRNTVRLLQDVGMPTSTAFKAVSYAFPLLISLRTVRRICREPYWTPEDISAHFRERFQLDRYPTSPEGGSISGPT